MKYRQELQYDRANMLDLLENFKGPINSSTWINQITAHTLQLKK